jgi:acetoacetyl-CoA synthetase
LTDAVPDVKPIWRPSPARVRDANLTRFITFLRERGELPAGPAGVPLEYGLLHEWSITHPERFWRAVADFCDVQCDGLADSTCIGLDRMAPPDATQGPRWFVGATLNFAENLLRFRDDRPALIAWNEQGRQ